MLEESGERVRDSADFLLAESAAGAGDTVHFSISGRKGRVEYELEVEDIKVLEGRAGGGDTVSDQFTMPDLGGTTRTVTVEAEIEASHEKTTLERKLEYLGPDQALTSLTGTPSLAVTAAPEQTVTAPQASLVPDAGAPPAQGTPAARNRSTQTLRNKPRLRAGERRRRAPAADRSRTRASRKRASRGRRSEGRRNHQKRRAPRRGWFLYGLPQAAGTESPGGDDKGPTSLNAIAPRTAFLSGTVAGSVQGGGITASVLVPALLGMAALGLAGTAMLRRRRLAATEGRADSPSRRS